MKMSSAALTAIACTALLAAVAFAQPQVPTPAVPNVPAVSEPQVQNPEPPDIPAAAGPGSAIHVEAPSGYCSCPTMYCAGGDVDSCEVHCAKGKTPVCSCDGFCTDSDNPRGLNRCDCE